MGAAYLNTALHAEHDLNHFDTFINSSTDLPGQNLPSHQHMPVIVLLRLLSISSLSGLRPEFDS